MKECLLCERDMSVSKDTFGKGCIKNIYKFLNLKEPKKQKLREKELYNIVMKENQIKNLNKNQKIWLTDRYLTYKYVEKLEYGNYESLKREIYEDIKNIENTKDKQDIKSKSKINLKKAYELYKKMVKFKENIIRLKNCDFTNEESLSIALSSFSFIFNMGSNKPQYEKDSLKAMQFAFWQLVIEVGKNVGLDISADFLQHSLKSKPSNLYIQDGKVVEEIVKDKFFKNNVQNIVREYGKNANNFIFNSSENDKYPMSFNEKDLYFSIHSAGLKIVGDKQNNGKWKLNIMLHDKYDYSAPKGVIAYYNDTSNVAKSIFSSTLYNFANKSIKAGVMKEYYIDIVFVIDNYEV